MVLNTESDSQFDSVRLGARTLSERLVLRPCKRRRYPRASKLAAVESLQVCEVRLERGPEGRLVRVHDAVLGARGPHDGRERAVVAPAHLRQG